MIAKQMASVLFTIGGTLMNALAFNGTVFFSKLIDQSEKEHMEWKYNETTWFYNKKSQSMK